MTEEIVKPNFYKIKRDLMFKSIFANPNKLYLLESLLKEILKYDIKIISIKSPELPKSNMTIRNKTLDVIATSNDEEINIEVNSVSNTYYRRRNAAYIFKMYTDSVPVNGSYTKMNKFIQINLTDKSNINIPLFDKYEVISLKSKNKFIDNLEIYEIDISKINKKSYNNNEFKILRLLDMDKEELEQIHGDDKIMEEIRDKALELNKDTEMIRLMSDEQEAQMYINTEKDISFEEGLEKGKQEGLQQGIEQGIEKGIEKGIKEASISNAKEMFKLGLDIDIIMKVTKLTKEEIANIK